MTATTILEPAAASPTAASESSVEVFGTKQTAPRRRAGQRLPDSSNARTWWIIGLMVSAFSFCVVMHLRQSPYQLSTKPIDAIHLGDNVPGVNPGESADLAFGTTVDPESWRHIRLTGQHSSGALIEIDLLRPQSWLAEHNAEEGAVIPVEFGRIGIVGPVRVDSIQECPEIRAGPGKSVTGIYRHHDAPTILDLETSNGERIGVTPDHRFWSEDQQAFIPAGELVPGETLKLLDGTTQLADITTRPDTETVYTLEVQVEHVYHIAQSGILVHNCNTGYGVPKGEMVDVWRIVEKRELDDIILRGNRYHSPSGTLSPTGQPGKWFYGSKADALDTAKTWGKNGDDFFLTKTQVPKSALDDLYPGIDNTPTMPLGKDGYFVDMKNLTDSLVEIFTP
ncbi:MAG: hypothetical protein ISQ06_16085 [Planctomycetaceae bacterium]|nr:hypothetical protein [Planctomycetaceae bacterium]